MKTQSGFRLGVGMVLVNEKAQVFLAERGDKVNAWQFPQGGLLEGESVEAALYRELFEEVGLKAFQVELIAQTKEWHEYVLPRGKRQLEGEKFLGQRQKWFLLRVIAQDGVIDLSSSATPEFARWEWVDYWEPLSRVVFFKHSVYKAVLNEFIDFLSLKKKPDTM